MKGAPVIGALYVHRETGQVGELARTRIALSGAMRCVVHTGRADIDALPEAFELACAECSGSGHVEDGEVGTVRCGTCRGRGW